MATQTYNVPVTSAHSNPQGGVDDCQSCRQVRNFSPTRFMYVNDASGGWENEDANGQRASELVWTGNPAKNNIANATYANDPFGYLRLAPVTSAGQLVQPDANASLSLNGATIGPGATGVMPPMTQYSINPANAPDTPPTFAAIEGPMDTSTWTAERYLTINATHNGSAGCHNNIGTEQQNQISDNSQFDNVTWRNFYYGASDTGSFQHGGDWEHAQDLVALAPNTGAAFWGTQYLDSSPIWGCANGCHKSDYGCDPLNPFKW
jgi:hypothetical protein